LNLPSAAARNPAMPIQDNANGKVRNRIAESQAFISIDMLIDNVTKKAQAFAKLGLPIKSTNLF
jgi:hypothetical protein